ncbi:MAG: response regulator transcription factor [Stenotrophomonas sp.]|uniref:response regulator transcription factor n=1 Tax=Stenotrophomonas sp. TaxID=69392 RepID=UPI002FCBDF9A
MEIRVVVADDHPVVLQGVRAILHADNRYRVVGEATSPGELAAVLEQTPADVLLTDFSMPGGPLPDGQAMLAAVRRRHPELPILVMTMFNSLPSLRAALRLGVRGILDKSAAFDRIAHAISRVSAGGTHIDEGLRLQLEEVDAAPHALHALTPCEFEVLRLYVSGPSLTEIATRFNRTISTVSRQRASAMKKLGIRTDAELFVYSIAHGICQVPGVPPPSDTG